MTWDIGAYQSTGWDIGAAQGSSYGGIFFNGTGITPFYLYVNKFTPVTRLSLKWIKRSDNNWCAVDRGTLSDIYQTEMTFIGSESTINNVITQFEANRAADDHELTLSNFNQVDDQIFGIDLDYSGSITVTIIDYDNRPQRTLNSWSFKFTLQAISFTYDGTPSLPTVTPEIGYKSYTDRTIKKIDTYDGTFSYSDQTADSGVFEGVFELFTDDAKSFKRYLCSTIRGDDLTITIAGVAYPLGPNRGTGSVDVKVLSFKEEQVNINRWRYTLNLTEVI